MSSVSSSAAAILDSSLVFFFFLLDAIYFIWFGVRYFYISISILVTCFVMQLSYLETVDPLGSLLPLG